MKALFTVATLLLAFGAHAQTATPRIDKREDRQEARIQQGAASGTLTDRETQRLEHQQGRIDRMQDRAAADGQVTHKERAKITAVQNEANRDIRRKKHNRRHEG
jgi:hypothetical protein